MRRLKYWQAISEALVQCMENDPSIFIAGAGVDDPRGIFGTTLAAHKRFGPERVFDIPNCENAFTGVALGAAAVGKRPVVVHARNDFMFLAADQIINLAAKHVWRTHQGAGVVSSRRGARLGTGSNPFAEYSFDVCAFSRSLRCDAGVSR